MTNITQLRQVEQLDLIIRKHSKHGLCVKEDVEARLNPERPEILGAELDVVEVGVQTTNVA